jgi:hypothetical protein
VLGDRGSFQLLFSVAPAAAPALDNTPAYMLLSRSFISKGTESSQTRRWRKADSNSWSRRKRHGPSETCRIFPRAALPARSGPNPSEGPIVRIRFPPAESHERTVGRAAARCFRPAYGEARGGRARRNARPPGAKPGMASVTSRSASRFRMPGRPGRSGATTSAPQRPRSNARASSGIVSSHEQTRRVRRSGISLLVKRVAPLYLVQRLDVRP